MRYLYFLLFIGLVGCNETTSEGSSEEASTKKTSNNSINNSSSSTTSSSSNSNNNSTSSQSIADNDYTAQFLEAHQRLLKAVEQKNIDNEIKLELFRLINEHSDEISIDKDLWTIYRDVFEDLSIRDTENKDLFKLESYMYIKCQNKIDISFNSHNQSIINDIINNFTADTYVDSELYTELVRCKNEVNKQNQLIKESEESAYPKQETNNSSNAIRYHETWVDAPCEKCNKKFQFRTFKNGWQDVYFSQPGYVKCGRCDLGIHYTGGFTFESGGKLPKTEPCPFAGSRCTNGWDKCSKCYGTGKVRERRYIKN